MSRKRTKNVLNRVIGPVEFRKIGYFATWWRPFTREHNFRDTALFGWSQESMLRIIS